jgi:hypothetical protein
VCGGSLDIHFHQEFYMFRRVLIGAAALSAAGAWACDLCATHVALTSWEAKERTSVSLFQQYSDYDEHGDEPSYESGTTQLGVGYRFADRWSAQLSVPYLSKDLGGDSESGLGDLTALALYRAVNAIEGERIVLVDVYAGLKMPTGDSDRLEEERNAALPEEAEHAEEHHDEHAEHAGFFAGHAGEDHVVEADEEHGHAIGHHVALGSGSWDGIFGARGLAQQGRWRGSAEAQYAARTEGDYDYEYGDEFIARAGARYFALLDHQGSVALGADLSREWSDDNQVLGDDQPGTGKSASYVGPALDVTWGERLTASAAWDIPIEGEDEGVHGAADTRVRASLSWLF